MVEKKKNLRTSLHTVRARHCPVSVVRGVGCVLNKIRLVSNPPPPNHIGMGTELLPQNANFFFIFLFFL